MRRALLSLILVSSTAHAAPLAGTWKISGDVQGYPIHETCTLTGDDASLTGTCTGAKSYPATATRKGDMLTLKHGGEYQGQDLDLTFTGKLQADGTLSGSIDVQPLNYDGTFKATRTADIPAKP